VSTKLPPEIPQASGPTQTCQPTPDPSQPPSRRSVAMARREGGEGNDASVIKRQLPSLYLFSAPTKNWPGARDLSRRNVGTADPRWEVSRHRRQPTFLRTKVRAPFARAAIRLNTYPLPRRGWGGL